MTEAPYEGEERRATCTAIHNLHRMMDSQDKILLEVRDLVVGHLAQDTEQKKVDAPLARSLEEISLLWRASKIIVPVLIAVAIGVVACIQWWKDHVK